MSRLVTGDHVLFDECINAFRSETANSFPFNSGESYSYLLTPFELTGEWELGICRVFPSTRVILPGAYSAFISKVKNPDWVGQHNSHLFGIALSTIVSSVLLKDCKSTRDGYLCRSTELSERDLLELAILHPILTAGPGCTHCSISQERQSRMQVEISSIIDKLMSAEYKKYRHIMQSLRLIHLSISTKKDDFGLAYLLAVSAIESVAQRAISRDKVKKKHPNEKLWRERAIDDPSFKEVLDAYLESRGKNGYLKERFVRFILKYAPVEKWFDYVEHPMQLLADYVEEITPSLDMVHLTGKQRNEKYPQDFTESEIEKILSDAYVHRSYFVHRGEQPPHTDPNPLLNRFFQKVTEYDHDGHRVKESILPNYEMLIGLAKASILNWVAK
ncbi:hypothetical protein [Vibrio alginolyticus]|uniref:hypothetical protein n=1 Tax=Vibrio alginolyticus TaxID=663 RepID=UPI001EEE5B28|nr:hypothetical protein [Vibrio alginolyticus]ULF83403.1 hypothetical protein K6750_04740 [Vibrio alginolyticus]